MAETVDLFSLPSQRDGPFWPPLPYKYPRRRKRLFISFSGGRTSAAMTYMLLLQLDPSEWEIVILFANTGEEDEETLRFVDRCDRLLFQPLGGSVVWIEGVTDLRKGKGQSFKVVTFETAARDGEPFRKAIEKFGVPNSSVPHCTRETKVRPMEAYLRSIRWRAGTYTTALGIRADEIDRLKPTAKKDKIWYPLAELGATKVHVVLLWRGMPFDLYIPEHRGNCLTCWKKSLRKLMTVAKESPEAFDFNREMERAHGWVSPIQLDKPRRFFRDYLTADEIIAKAQQPFEPFVDGNEAFDPELDVGGGCGDSCEIYTDEAA